MHHESVSLDLFSHPRDALEQTSETMEQESWTKAQAAKVAC